MTSLTCFSQSTSNNIDLVGTWVYYVGFFECRMTINKDSTYKFQVEGDLTNRKSEGVWKLKNKKLIFNSNKQKPTETIIIAKYIDSLNGIRFLINTEIGEPVCMPHIRIKTKLTKIDTSLYNQCEIFEFKEINNIQKFKISFVGLKDAIWIGKMNRNYFEIVMAEEFDDYIYQANEIWTIKKNRLYSPTSKKDNRYYKKKGRINYYLKEEY